jgi:hypothetical protein
MITSQDEDSLVQIEATACIVKLAPLNDEPTIADLCGLLQLPGSSKMHASTRARASLCISEVATPDNSHALVTVSKGLGHDDPQVREVAINTLLEMAK